MIVSMGSMLPTFEKISKTYVESSAQPSPFLSTAERVAETYVKTTAPSQVETPYLDTLRQLQAAKPTQTPYLDLLRAQLTAPSAPPAQASGAAPAVATTSSAAARPLLPWILGGAAVIGVGALLLRRRS